MAKNNNLQKPKLAGGKHILPPDQPQSESYGHLRPVFSLHFHDGREFCITACEKDEQAAFARQLYQISQKTWNELGQIDHKALGYEQIPRGKFNAKSPKGLTDDVTRLMVFRFFGKGRIAGYRDKDVFHIVWVDCTFKLYPHGS